MTPAPILIAALTLSRHRVSPFQMAILLLCDGKHRGVTELANECGQSVVSASITLNRMEEKGWIYRHRPSSLRDGLDRRHVVVEVTRKGREDINAILAAASKLEEEGDAEAIVKPTLPPPTLEWGKDDTRVDGFVRNRPIGEWRRPTQGEIDGREKP